MVFHYVNRTVGDQWVTSSPVYWMRDGHNMAGCPCSVHQCLQRVTNQRATSVTHRVTRGWPWNRTKWWLQEVTRSYYSWTDHCKRTKARNHMKTDRNGKVTAFWDQPGLNPIKRCKTNGLNWFNNTEYVALLCELWTLWFIWAMWEDGRPSSQLNLIELSKRPGWP